MEIPMLLVSATSDIAESYVIATLERLYCYGADNYEARGLDKQDIVTILFRNMGN